MSVLIKGMDMPNRCESCGFLNPYRLPMVCGLTGTRILGDANARLDNCPFVELPPHGRLIDADKFKYDECEICDGCCETFNGNECSMCHKECRCEFMKDIDEAPTIIEAEEVEDDTGRAEEGSESGGV